MILLADIGNTNITFGVYRENAIIANWRLSSRVSMTVDEFWILLKMLMDSEGFEMRSIEGFALSSVVPNLTPIVERTVQQKMKVPYVCVSSSLNLGIEILYENPQQVGADRLCNAVAGFDRYGGPIVIVDFGTATTFDVMSKDAEYLGGIIAPGPETTTMVLHRAAARLPKVELQFPPSLIGATTETSIQSGLMFGGVEMIDGLNRRLKEELGEETQIIATGGLAKVFLPHLKTVNIVEPNLTLEGLASIYERCVD